MNFFLVFASVAFAASAPAPQRQLQERQVRERLELAGEQQAEVRRLRVSLDDEESIFRRRLADERDTFSAEQRWSLKLFNQSLRGRPRLDAKAARRAFEDKQKAERRDFDEKQARRRLQFYAEQRAKLRRLRVIEGERKRQLSIDQRGARELQSQR